MGKRFDYEYVVVGGGVAGTTAAKQLATAGRKVAIVEQRGWNDEATKRETNARSGKTVVVKGRVNTESTRLELEKAGVTCIHGRAQFAGQYDLMVSEQEKPISANKFILATGAELDTGMISGVDKVSYETSESTMEMKHIPKTVLVVGGGASGCETAQYLAKLGAKVVIVEMAARLLPKEDEEVGKVMQQYFEKRFHIKTFTQTRVMALERDKISPRVVFMRGGQERTVRVEGIVLVTGRKPVLDLDLPKVKVSFDKNGIIVDKTFQTSARNAYAIGDAIGGESSVERAVYTAELAVTNMLGRSKNFANFNGFTRVTNTEPQVATVGMTEDELLKRVRKYRKVMVPLSEIEAAKISGFKIGFMKMAIDHQNKVLGATMVGPCAAEVLAEVALVVRHGLSLTEIASTPHVAESWGAIVRVAARKLLNATKR